MDNKSHKIKNTSLGEKQSRNRRLAIVGIHATEKEQATDCPSSEELAMVAEQNADDKLRTKIINHIATCEDCYEEWLLLTEISATHLKKQKRKDNVHFFSSPKVLTAIGSGLAMAASIAVFINLPQYAEEGANVMYPTQEDTVATAPQTKKADYNVEETLDSLVKAKPVQGEKRKIAAAKPQSKVRGETISRQQNDISSAAQMAAPASSAHTELDRALQNNEMMGTFPRSILKTVAVEEFEQAVRLFCQASPATERDTKLYETLQSKSIKVLQEAPGLTPQQRNHLAQITMKKNEEQSDIEAFCTNTFALFKIEPQEKSAQGQ